MPVHICHHEIRSIQNQHQSAHVFVNVAPQRDQTRLIKNLYGNWTFLRAITAEIKSFGGRVGKDVVVSVVKIREFNLRTNSYREKRWNEGQILLRDFFRWQRSWTRESTLEINYDFGSSTRPSMTPLAKSATGMMENTALNHSNPRKRILLPV